MAKGYRGQLPGCPALKRCLELIQREGAGWLLPKNWPAKKLKEKRGLGVGARTTSSSQSFQGSPRISPNMVVIFNVAEDKIIMGRNVECIKLP